MLNLIALAGSWQVDSVGRWYLNDDGSYPVSKWEWIDTDGDGKAYCYYFDGEGYLVTNDYVDGYMVDDTGVYRDENGYAVEKIINESLSSSIGYDGISGIYSFNYGDNFGKKIESVNSKYQNIELKKEDDSHITLIS